MVFKISISLLNKKPNVIVTYIIKNTLITNIPATVWATHFWFILSAISSVLLFICSRLESLYQMRRGLTKTVLFLCGLWQDYQPAINWCPFQHTLSPMYLSKSSFYMQILNVGTPSPHRLAAHQKPLTYGRDLRRQLK